MENLYELLEEAAHKVPTKGIVIVNNSQCDLFLTYSELREKSRKIAFILDFQRVDLTNCIINF